jgi:hypothetical protein
MPVPVNLQIAAGQILKTSASPVFVQFTTPFAVTPTVVLTPNFPNEVTFVDTVTNVSDTGFTINSPNAGPNYYVNWVAITPGT